MKMTSVLVYALFFSVLSSCQTENNSSYSPTPLDSLVVKTPTHPEPINDFDIDLHLKNYHRLRADIISVKKDIHARVDIGTEEKVNLAKDYLSTTLIDSIFPYWLGTTWDFNGHTDEPMVGEVACGYFVSTTIRHMDVKINRYKVAQKAAAAIITELCDASSIKNFNAMDKLETHLETVDDYQVLIIGLDFHVGFIFKKNGEAFFAHSNYEDLKGVEIVPVKNCFALESSNNYVLGSLTANKKLVENWMNGP